MKALLAALAAFVLLSLPASAMEANSVEGPITILPICSLHGPVYLEVKDYDVSGFIGNERVNLDLNEENLADVKGTAKGVDIDLYLTRSGTVSGTIGRLKASWFWTNTPKGQVIFGFQPCLFD